MNTKKINKILTFTMALSFGGAIGAGGCNGLGLIGDDITVPLCLSLMGIGIISVFLLVAIINSRRSDSYDSLNYSHDLFKGQNIYEVMTHAGERFDMWNPGTAGLMVYDEEKITLHLADDDVSSPVIRKFKKDEVEVLWIGRSGRFKERTYWLKIRDQRKSCIITGRSQFPVQLHESDNQGSITNLYYALSDLGYRVDSDCHDHGARTKIFIMTINLIGAFALSWKLLADTMESQDSISSYWDWALPIGVYFLVGCIFFVSLLNYKPANPPPRE